MRWALCAAAMAAAATGCAVHKPEATSAEAARLATVDRYDQFTKARTITGENLAFMSGNRLQLQRVILDGGRPIDMIRVQHNYNGSWRFYESAHSARGEKLPLTVVDRQVGSCAGTLGCSHYETVAIELTPEQLTYASNYGFTFKVIGKRGDDLTLHLPPPYVQGFLEAAKAAER